MSVLLMRVVALSCVIGTSFFLSSRSPATPTPEQDEVIKAALVKGFSEIYLTPTHLFLDSSLRVRIIGRYDVGRPVAYNPELYDHRYKLSNVPPGATLYPIKAKFEMSGSKRTMPPDGLRKKLARFLCYEDNYGEFVCKLISDEDI